MPATPGQVIYFGPDGGPFIVVSSDNPLPATVKPTASGGTFPVGGQSGAGAALSGNPVGVGVSDGTNLQWLKGDSSGRAILGAGEQHVGLVGGVAANPSANFSRPADTTAYASGDLVANSTTAGSVVALQFTAARVSAGNGQIRRARLKKTGTTTTNATFRLHLYGADPTASSGITNGDNGAWLTKQATYLGSIIIDLTASTGRVFSDFSEGLGAPDTGAEINFALASGQTVYGLLEARAAYTPASGETFTVELEVVQN